MQTAQRNGKLSQDHRIPVVFRSNLPERLTDQLSGFKDQGYFPAFPFGTDLTEIEITLGKALQALQSKLATPGGAAKAALRALEVGSVPEAAGPYLERMGLDAPRNLKEKIARKMIAAELIAEGVI